MTTNLYTQQGVDFDDWFSIGTGTQNFDIFSEDGVDIGQKYLAGSGSIESGFRTSSNEDLCTKLGGYGYGIYRVGGVPWNVYLGWDQEKWWTNWLNKFNTNHTTCKNVSGIMDDSYCRNVCSDNAHSICVFGYSPPGGSAITFSCVEKNREYGCGNHDHYMRFFPVTISPYLKGVVIWRCCGAGDDPYSEYYFTLSQAGQQTLYYSGVFGCVNDDNNPTYGSSGWDVTKWGRRWYWHP